MNPKTPTKPRPGVNHLPTPIRQATPETRQVGELASLAVPALEWTSVATGAAGGLAVGLLNAWTTAERERSGQLRERMLDLADAFIVAFRDAERCTQYEEPNVAESERLQRELRMLTARIELLYGRRSSVAYHAREATEALEDLSNLLREPGGADVDDEDFDSRVWARKQRIERGATVFMSASGAAIRTGGRHPARAWIKPRMLMARALVFTPKKWRAIRKLKATQARRAEASLAIEEAVRELEEAKWKLEELEETEREAGEAQPNPRPGEA
jgi:hypothetical protein